MALKMKIPYLKQETNYTCGAACMRMILASMNIKKSEKQISNLLKTNKKIGTWHKQIPELAEKYKLDYIIERKGKISDLRKLLKEKWKIIICYIYNKEPHYSIIKKINWHSIHLINPANKNKDRYLIPSFKKRWRDKEDKKWFAALKKSN